MATSRSAPGSRSKLLQRIGEGTFGEVYRARDALQREVAVKLLAAQPRVADKLGEKVLREARILARIRHSNVVLVHNAETHDGASAVDGADSRATLEHLLHAHGAFSAREAAFIGQDLCRALARSTPPASCIATSRRRT